MQAVSQAFTNRTQAGVRKLNWRVLISFAKDYDAAADFFEIGVSSIGGNHPLKGTGSAIQEWDKYTYDDYSDRVLSIEYNREAEMPTAPLTLATLDIVLDNHDDIFTPGNANSPLDGFIKPRRPIRVHIGFGNLLVPVFVGLTDGIPEIDERSKTARFHAEDFLKLLLDQPLDEAVMYVNTLTSTIISGLLQSAGLGAIQFDLDTGSVVIPFAYFPKGTKLGQALHEIAEAELGNLSMDETGVIKFYSRTTWADNVETWAFDKSSVFELSSPTDDHIINVVEVISRNRQLQENQLIYQMGIPQVVPANGSLEIFADFMDEDGDLPVTGVDDPEYIDLATTSLYKTNQFAAGDGPTLDSDISMDSVELFGTTAKVTFSNSGDTPIWITEMEIWGTPARVVGGETYVRVEDTASVGVHDGNEERVHTIKNDFIQGPIAANSIAQIIIGDRAEYDDRRTLLVRGVPQLQVGDVVSYADEIVDETYFVTRVSGILNENGFRQTLELSKRVITDYFRIGYDSIETGPPLGP